MLVATIVIVLNVVLDFLSSLINPRLRHVR
jgi:ABC-type dipeptide/oligopeptide/nickel transport system permease component